MSPNWILPKGCPSHSNSILSTTWSEAIPEPAVKTGVLSPSKAKAKAKAKAQANTTATGEDDVIGTGAGSSVPRITDLPDYLDRRES